MPQRKRSLEIGGFKFCLGCSTWRPADMFYAKTPTRKRARCSVCLADAQRARRALTRKPKPTLLQRIVRRSVTTPTGCMEWRGTVNLEGYGMIQAGLRTATGNQRQSKVHRVVWERLFGPVPAGRELDHLCFDRRCWHPAHLQPVTKSENSRRARAREIALYGMPKGGRGRPAQEGVTS